MNIKNLLASLALLATSFVPSQAAGFTLSIGNNAEGTTTGLQILILLTILSVAPAILLMMTAFIRIVIVFSMLRQAMGIGQLPPNQVIIGLSLILTFLVMSPSLKRVNDEALQPFMAQKMTHQEFYAKAMAPFREFMFKQTRENDLRVILKLAKVEKPSTRDDVESHALIAAFVLSELKTAFQIGFTIFLPFIIMDMIFASALVSMGLMFLPPTTISLPFKAILFVLIDGWTLLSEALVNGFIS